MRLEVCKRGRVAELAREEVLVDAEHLGRDALGVLRDAVRVALVNPPLGRRPRDPVAVANARQRVAVLVALDDLLLEQLARALVRQHPRHALPEIATAATAPLRHVDHEPVRTSTDAGVADAPPHEILAAMRSL